MGRDRNLSWAITGLFALPFLSPFSDEKGAKNPGCENPFDSGSGNPDDSLRIPLFGILELSLSGPFAPLNFRKLPRGIGSFLNHQEV